MAENPKNSNSGEYYNNSGATLEKLPDQVQLELAAHLQQYLHDPEKAHIWDPIVIGVPSGPVKTLLLTTTGRKSGRQINNVLQYYKFNEQIAIVASRGGTVEHPAWYLNLLADARCNIRIAGATSQAIIRTLEGPERERWWQSITAEQPAQLVYQARCPRIIPVAVLEFEEPAGVLAVSV